MSMPSSYRLGSKTLYTPQEMAQWQDDLETKALGAIQSTVLNQIKHIFMRRMKGDLGLRISLWRGNHASLLRQRAESLASDKRSLEEQKASLEKEKKTLQKVGRSVRKEADELKQDNHSLKVLLLDERAAAHTDSPCHPAGQEMMACAGLRQVKHTLMGRLRGETALRLEVPPLHAQCSQRRRCVAAVGLGLTVRYSAVGLGGVGYLVRSESTVRFTRRIPRP